MRELPSDSKGTDLPERARNARKPIAVELASSRPANQRRDYEEKQQEYRDIQIQEFWIVDRFRRTMTLYRWRGKRWLRQVVTERETYEPPLLPGFELPLAKLLAVSNKYRRR